jgi:hypothetical protein
MLSTTMRRGAAGASVPSAARWKFHLHSSGQAASGLPVLVHLNGFARVRLK